MKCRICPHLFTAPIAFVFWWFIFSLYESGPIERYSRSVHPTDVRGGETIIVTSTVIRTKECSSTVYRQFIDASGRLVEFKASDAPTLAIGTERFRTQIVVPEGLVPGPLIYRVKVTFECNAVQRLLGGSIFILPDAHLTYLVK